MPTSLLADDGARRPISSSSEDGSAHHEEHTIDGFLTATAGEFGRYQQRHYALVASAWLWVAWATLSMVMTSQNPQWRLSPPGESGETSTEDPPCDQEFTLVSVQDSIRAEWALVCEDANLAALVGTLYFVGFMLGAFGLGALGDQIGRRPSARIAAAICCMSALASAAAPSPLVYTAFRMVQGFGVGGLATSAYVLASEIIGPSWQGVTGVGQSGIFSAGAILLVPLALALPSWRALTVATAVPMAIHFVVFGRVEVSSMPNARASSLSSSSFLTTLASDGNFCALAGVAAVAPRQWEVRRSSSDPAGACDLKWRRVRRAPTTQVRGHQPRGSSGSEHAPHAQRAHQAWGRCPLLEPIASRAQRRHGLLLVRREFCLLRPLTQRWQPGWQPPLQLWSRGE